MDLICTAAAPKSDRLACVWHHGMGGYLVTLTERGVPITEASYETDREDKAIAVAATVVLDPQAARAMVIAESVERIFGRH